MGRYKGVEGLLTGSSSREFLDVALLSPEVVLFRRLAEQGLVVHIYRRCVDDIIIRVDDARRLPQLLQMMGRAYPSTMTFNVQVSFRVARFLDYAIYKQKVQGGGLTGVHVYSMKYKETSSFVYSMPGSNVPSDYLYAAIVSHVWRAYRRNDRKLDVQRDLRVMKRIFKKRGFKTAEMERVQLLVEASGQYRHYRNELEKSGGRRTQRVQRPYRRCWAALLQLAVVDGEEDGSDYARRWLGRYKRKYENFGAEAPQYLSLTYDNRLGLHTVFSNVVYNVFGSTVRVALRTFRNRLNMISPKRVVNARLQDYMESK